MGALARPGTYSRGLRCQPSSVGAQTAPRSAGYAPFSPLDQEARGGAGLKKLRTSPAHRDCDVILLEHGPFVRWIFCGPSRQKRPEAHKTSSIGMPAALWGSARNIPGVGLTTGKVVWDRLLLQVPRCVQPFLGFVSSALPFPSFSLPASRRVGRVFWRVFGAERTPPGSVSWPRDRGVCLGRIGGLSGLAELIARLTFS